MRLTVRSLPALLLAGGIAGLVLPYARAQQQLQPKDIACLSNLKQINLGLLMYTQDYDETLPPTKSAAKMQTLLNPYLKNNSIFVCPATSTAYVVNPALSGKKLVAFKAPATTVTFYDAKPHADGRYRVGYLDGHVKTEAKAPAVAAAASATTKPAHKPK